MTDFSDEQIDQLLRDAEKRLLPAGSSSGSGQVAARLTEPISAVVGTNRDIPQKRKEELRVRSVAARGSDKARKVRMARRDVKLMLILSRFPNDEGLDHIRGS